MLPAVFSSGWRTLSVALVGGFLCVRERFHMGGFGWNMFYRDLRHMGDLDRQVYRRTR